MKILFFLSLLIVICSPAHAELTNAELAPLEKWIQHSSQLKAIKGEFTQKKFLKTLNKPLETTGQVYFAEPGSICWQIGSPLKTIATIVPGGALTVQDVVKKTAEITQRETLEAKAGASAIALLESGFPKSLESWRKQFSIDALERVENGYLKVTVSMAGKINAVIRKLEFFILEEKGMLGAIHFHMRDGSRIENQFTNLQENPTLPKNIFQPDLTGYEINKK